MIIISILLPIQTTATADFTVLSANNHKTCITIFLPKAVIWHHFKVINSNLEHYMCKIVCCVVPVTGNKLNIPQPCKVIDFHLFFFLNFYSFGVLPPVFFAINFHELVDINEIFYFRWSCKYKNIIKINIDPQVKLTCTEIRI